MIGIGLRPVKIGFAQEEKERLLKSLYDYYEQILSKVELACRPKCAACCTHNVTLTSTEAFYLLKGLKEKGRLDLLERVKRASSRPRYRPAVTTNELAKICLQGQEPPTEEGHTPGDCPLLEDDLCPIYEFRPFACRSLISKVPCPEKGEALIPPHLFTLNTALLQVLEYIDLGGLYGNMIDVILFLEAWERGEGQIIPDHLLSCHPIPELAVPPEHDHVVRPAIGRLYRQEIDGRRFIDRLEDLETALGEEPLSFLTEL
ncbi:YkgJ family cysteine cluster protein [Thermosulfuriphilus sp.]